MYNMRIDVVRKELEFRFSKILELKDTQSPKVNNTISAFMYFLLTTDGIKQFVLEIAKFEEKFKVTDEYKVIKKGIINGINTIATIATDGGFIDNFDFKTAIKSDGICFYIPYNLNNLENNSSIKFFLEYVGKFENYFDDDYSNSVSAIDSLYTIFEIADKLKVKYDHAKFNIESKELNKLVVRLHSHFNLRAEYEFAPSAARLIAVFKRSGFRPLIALNEDEYGEAVNIKEELQKIGDQSDWIHYDIEDCENLYHAVDKYLMTGKSKSALIARLITYCTWIRRKEFPKTIAKTKYKNEKAISKIIQGFIFDQGYFPIVDFTAGNSKPDILAMKGDNLSWDNSILIEIKQFIGESCTISKVDKAIAQAKSYLDIVKGAKPDISDLVYLLVFYDGDKILLLDESHLIPNVEVEFIYVGRSTPSKLKGPIKLGEK